MATLILRLAKDNPYINGNVIDYGDGTYKLERQEFKYTPSTKDKYHTVIEEESLSSISFQYYGTSKYWFIIKDVNPDLEDIWNLPAGLILLVPDKLTIFATN